MRRGCICVRSNYKNSGAYKYPKIFQCDNGSEFKNEVTKLLEKHNVEIRRATTKYKHTHTVFVESFNKELAKLLFKSMDANSFKTLKKYRQFGSKTRTRP